MFKNQHQKRFQKEKEEWFNFISVHLSQFINLISKDRNTKQIKYSIDNYKSLCLIVYFKRNDIKFIVEKWEFNIIEKPEPNQNLNFYFNKIKINKKLLTLQRSIILLLKILPLYSLFNQKNFEFEFEVDITHNEVNQILSNKITVIKLDQISDNFATFDIKISYISQSDIFSIEDELKMKSVKKQIEIRQNWFVASKVNSENNRKMSLSNSDTETANNFNTSFNNKSLNNISLINDYSNMLIERNEVNNINKKYNEMINNTFSYEQEEANSDDDSIDEILIESSFDNKYKNEDINRMLTNYDENMENDISSISHQLFKIQQKSSQMKINSIQLYSKVK